MGAIKVVRECEIEFNVKLDKDLNSGLLNGETFNWDVIKIKENQTQKKILFVNFQNRSFDFRF